MVDGAEALPSTPLTSGMPASSCFATPTFCSDDALAATGVSLPPSCWMATRAATATIATRLTAAIRNPRRCVRMIPSVVREYGDSRDGFVAPACSVGAVTLAPDEDAYGAILLAALEGRDAHEVMEREDGTVWAGDG